MAAYSTERGERKLLRFEFNLSLATTFGQVHKKTCSSGREHFFLSRPLFLKTGPCVWKVRGFKRWDQPHT